MSDLKLPPLPEPDAAGYYTRVVGGLLAPTKGDLFTEHQMREYARRAVYEWEAAIRSPASQPEKD